jgi:hypothetical protein
MAILTNRPARRAMFALLAAAIGTAAAGCALIGVFSDQPYAFGHRVHAKEGLECADCHASWESDDSPGMPMRGGCVLCHEEIDKTKPPERRIEVLFDGDVFKAKRVTALDDEIVFSHRQHATKPIECASCHGGIEENDVVDLAFAQRMSDCETCHVQQQVANECATCHRTLRTDVAPRSHDFQWTKLHGPTVRAHDRSTANDCSLCHQESTCASCHQSEPPENHGDYFRRRGHGLHARMDRQNCAACHRSDSCDACHRDTRPISHTGAFGGTISNHCVGCHLPLQSNECTTCHKGTPSHALATPKPADHNAGMNCRQCHGLGQSLPHADNGSDCNLCHR